MEILVQDLRYGGKALLKTPLFTALAIAIVALGIGLNTAIFSVVNGVLLRPLPYQDPGRLVSLFEESENGELNGVSLPNFLDWRDQNQVFEQMAAYRWQAFNLTSVEDPQLLDGWYVSSNFFPLLGVNPILGGTFLPEEDKAHGTPVVLLSYRLWQRQFAGDPNLIGQTITINAQDYTVIGIIPRDFRLYGPTGDGPMRPIDLWMPVSLWTYDMNYRGFPSASVIARLKAGVTLEQARANMAAIARQLEQQYPKTNTGIGVRMVSFYEAVVKDTRPALLVLLGAVGFVLLLACANVTNLLLARATTRHREVAIRTALGASRLRIIRQLLTESVLLAMTGGVFGLLLAFWGVHFLIGILPKNMPRIEEVGVDARVLGFTLFCSVLTGVGFGIAPSLQSSKLNLAVALKEGARNVTPCKGLSRLRSVLVATEVAVSVVLLVGAGLMIKSFLRLRATDLGFNAKNVLMMNFSLPITQYGTHAQRSAFYQQMLSRIEVLPGVQAAGAASPPALPGGGLETPIVVEGRQHTSTEDASTEYSLISYDYFRVLGIPLLKGRYFTVRDAEEAPLVAIIDDNLEHQLFTHEEDPIGKRLKLLDLTDMHTPVSATIVGVVRHVNDYQINADSKTLMYVPFVQAPMYKFTLVVRTGSNPLNLADAVRREVLQVDRGQPAYNIRTMEQEADQLVAPERLYMRLFCFLGVAALLLAGAGIYAVIAYSDSQRTHEIGIRMALGAQRIDVLRLIIRQGMSPTVVGLVIGLGLAFGLTRVLSSLLHKVSPTDLFTHVSIPLLLTAVAFLACYVPARKAIKVDPMVALRDE
ncbi:MAG TPA: ABC transporter permease [Blastocatellia bacterium]|nr:ABC transporter permease [Blastocatellia bacterium]